MSWTHHKMALFLYHLEKLSALFEFSLPGPNRTEVNCPICCQNHPHRLQRILAQEGELPGWGGRREMEGELPGFQQPCGALGLEPCTETVNSADFSLNPGSSHPPSFLSAQTCSRPNFCLKWTVRLFTREAAMCNGLEEAAPHGAKPHKLRF
jgi:hypothetical protein